MTKYGLDDAHDINIGGVYARLVFPPCQMAADYQHDIRTDMDHKIQSTTISLSCGLCGLALSMKAPGLKLDMKVKLNEAGRRKKNPKKKTRGPPCINCQHPTRKSKRGPAGPDVWLCPLCGFELPIKEPKKCENCKKITPDYVTIHGVNVDVIWCNTCLMKHDEEIGDDGTELKPHDYRNCKYPHCYEEWLEKKGTLNDTAKEKKSCNHADCKPGRCSYVDPDPSQENNPNQGYYGAHDCSGNPHCTCGTEEKST